VQVPLIVGGGIRDAEKLKAVYDAGADIAVVGNRFEENPELIATFAEVAGREY
jgi:putative glycerol-1-phosphate prenyltransferase